MDGSHFDLDPFSELDGSRVPESWWPDLSRSLLELGDATSAIDRPTLTPLTCYLARNQRVLRTQAAVHAPVTPPTEIHGLHPGSATLFRFQHGRSTGLELLTNIGLCALLEARSSGSSHPRQLLSIVRGAMGGANSTLTGVLGAISTIPELVRVVNTDELVRSALPPHFTQLWKAWLGDTLLRWMHSHASQVRRSLEPSVLSPQLDDPILHVSVDGRSQEFGPSLICNNVPPSELLPEGMTTTRAGRAASDLLERASAGDPLAAPEQRLPGALDERLCRAAAREASVHLEDPARSEPYAALALVLAGAIREIDLPIVVWGASHSARPLAIDPTDPVLYRRLKRPANAVVPPKHLSTDWLMPSAEVVAWPLPNSVHQALLALAGGNPIRDQGVLPMLAASPFSPYRMRDVIARLVPEAKVGALAPRLALASEISSELGTEVAQLAMADTFGISSIPAYYSAMPEAELASFIAGIQSRRFAEHVKVPTERNGYVGSRLVLTDYAARQWPTLLGKALKDTSRQSQSCTEAWSAHRNHLVAALCCATGHRPEDALGRIHLWDVIPEYGLVVLQDKQVDALRSTRIAATGRLWLSDLRRYLDRLREIASRHAEEPAGRLASAILGNDAPLFSLPSASGGIAHMTAATLREGMPAELACVDNFFRHRLNQKLLERRVDPELRHAQLGWVVSPAHFHSDLSPRAPMELGHDLASVIDDILTREGWYRPSARRTRWTWEGVPMPSPVDWDAAFASEKRRHEEALKQVKLDLQKRWRDLEGPVLTRLADAFQEFCPLLRVDLEKKCLVLRHGGLGRVELNGDHHALICDRVRLGDQELSSGLEAATARILLYRLVRRARDKGIVQGPIPGRPYLSVTSEPSPFVPGLGAAIRHAHAVRHDIEERATQRQVRDLGQLTVWSIMAFSMYRRMPWARAATHAARTAMRAKRRGHILRIDARIDGRSVHMVFSGGPAILLARRKKHAPTSPAPSREALEDWAAKHLCGRVAWGESCEASGRIESSLAAAAKVELSGIERLLMQMGTETAAESPIRCIAKDDRWPIQASDGASEPPDEGHTEPPLLEASHSGFATGPSRKDYEELMATLNKRVFAKRRAGKTKGKRKEASDGQHGWHGALRHELEVLRDRIHVDPNMALLVSYVLDHLRYGSEDGHRLSQNSLRREVSQIGWPLICLAEGREIQSMPAEGLRNLYLAVLLSKTTQGRPYVVEELRRLHRFLMRLHSRPALDWGELSLLAGKRQLGIEPGLLTAAEVHAVEAELQVDYRNEMERDDASPDFLRLTQLRRIYFLVMEASGIRPGSAYGLTLGDVHFLGDGGDFVHLRKGEYGEVKTHTSLGFVRLEGDLWNQHRKWVEGWIKNQATIHPETWRELPLFGAKPGLRIRVQEQHLSSRVNSLLKWATGDRKASCYWLRKSRISQRYESLASNQKKTARDVYRAMAASGHAWIQTPIQRYNNDPSSLMVVDLEISREAPRAHLLALSGLDPGPVDAAWHRAGERVGARLEVVLDRIDARFVDVPSEHRVPAPALHRFNPLKPVHVDNFARAMQRHKNVAEASLAAGITSQQAAHLGQAAERLLGQRGCAPWRLEGLDAVRYVLPAPRKIAGTEKWFALMDEEPSDDLRCLAASWANQPHSERLHGKGTVMQVESRLLPALMELLERTQLNVNVCTKDGRHLLKAASNVKYKKGHAPALAWVFSIIWLYAPPPLAGS